MSKATKDALINAIAVSDEAKRSAHAYAVQHVLSELGIDSLQYATVQKKPNFPGRSYRFLIEKIKSDKVFQDGGEPWVWVEGRIVKNNGELGTAIRGSSLDSVEFGGFFIEY